MKTITSQPSQRKHCAYGGHEMYLFICTLFFRFSALVRDKPLCSSWEKKMAAKREKELVKKYSLQLKEDKAREKEVCITCSYECTNILRSSD